MTARRSTADPTSEEDRAMGDDDKMQNMADEKVGEAKEAVGDATDDKDLEREGKTDQTKADLKQAGEKVKDAFN
jgi:uncharacterized protein YjbJ (UPF0337 family)